MKRDDNGKFVNGTLPPKTAFKKGMVPWNVGKRYKLGENPKRKGKHYSPNTEFKKGVYYSYSHHYEKGHIPWFKEKGLSHPLTGKKHSKEWKEKISAGHQKVKLEEWNGYKTPQNIIERKRFRREIKSKVLERDNYVCQICGSRDNLQIDHIQPWSEYIELRFSLDNCRTLCQKCHYKITFGKPIPTTIKMWGVGLNKKYG